MDTATPVKVKRAIFSAIPVLLIGTLTVGFIFWYRWYNDPLRRGHDLNQSAWEHSYTERGLKIPPRGPREGYWGARLGTAYQDPDPNVRWRLPFVFVPGLLDIDSRGHQFFISQSKSKSKVLILGGSVAFGAYASTIRTTYFDVLGAKLEKDQTPADIRIIAAGAWKSSQELAALKRHLKSTKPQWIVFLNGLNDLINGATAHTQFGEEVPTRDGSPWTSTYHAHDYEERVELYLENMQQASEIAASAQCKLLIVLQPSLVEKKVKSPVEAVVLKESLRPHASAEALLTSYDAMRIGLTELAEKQQAQFLDASRVFDGETKTVFSDMWHFSDIGHKILGEAMASKISPLLETTSPTERPADASSQ